MWVVFTLIFSLYNIILYIYTRFYTYDVADYVNNGNIIILFSSKDQTDF